MQITQPIKDLSVEFKRYLNLRVNHVNLLISRRFAMFTSFVLTTIILLGLIGFILLMLSFAFVFWYGKSVGSYHHGFLIMALFYSLSGLAIYLNKKEMFIDPIIRKMNEKISNTLDEEEIIAKPENLQQLDHETDLMKLKIKHSELVIQQQFNELGERLNPFNFFADVIGKTLNISAFILPILELTVSFLRNRKGKEDGNDTNPSDS